MMKLYLVRHGQSTGNLDSMHQDRNTLLSSLGRQQARELAKRFKTIPVDVILTSHYTRAYETAKIIAKEIVKPLEKNELLREIKRPSEIEGKSISDTVAITIINLIKANIHDSTWHYADEENISDLIFRAKKFIQYLEKRNENNIVAISHGRLIQAICEVIILGNALIPRIYEESKEKMYLSNTGITVLEKTDTGWHLITWNDDAHLGNI